MKTIIAPKYRTEDLYHTLSSENRNFINNIRIQSLSSMLKSDEKEDKNATILLGSHLLNERKEKYVIYGEMFKFAAFIQELLTFVRTCILFGITKEDLPADTPDEKELKEILAELMTLPLEEKEIYSTWKAKTDAFLSTHDVEYVRSFETDPFRVRLKDYVEKHACGIDETCVCETKELRYASTARQEIEALAQELCRDDVRCTVILADYANQLPVLHQVFNRYGISYQPYEEAVSSKAGSVYNALLALAMRKDCTAFLNALRLQAFGVEFEEQMISFLEEAMLETGEIPDISSYLTKDKFEQEKGRYAAIEQDIAKQLEPIREPLELLLRCDSPQSALRNAWTLFRKHPLTKSKRELEAALQIRSTLNACLELVESEQDVEILSQLIQDIGVKNVTVSSDRILVTDLRHPVPATERVYILGCSGRAYPNVPSCTGLFDEAYVAKIEKYPSLQERFDSYMKQLDWITHSGKHLVYSYASNDYQGREIQLAYEIESTLPSQNGKVIRQPWTLAVKTPLYRKPAELTPDTAEKLFVDPDGQIIGSISRVERWFNCPYSYYIQSGLKIRKPFEAGVDATNIGTISHAFMEQSVKDYQSRLKEKKDNPQSTVDIPSYAKLLSEEDIRQFVHPYFEQLNHMHPHAKHINMLTEERMILGLNEALYVLRNYEGETLFKPMQQEMNFKEPITAGVTLNGIIDRLDTANGTLRVLDYKSSPHSLSEGKVLAGLQLQLLSYMIIAKEKTKLKPQGAAYFSLQPTTVDTPAAKASMSSKGLQDLMPMEKSVQEEAVIEERRLCGWKFSKDKDLDSESTMKWGRRGVIYDYDNIEHAMRALYDYFRKHLLDGEIAVDPVENACMFCDYAPICRKRVQERKATPVINAELQKPKEEKK